WQLIYVCSGTIIDKDWVVTPSECVVDIPTKDLVVIAGVTDLRTTSELKQVRAVADRRMHTGTGTLQEPLALGNSVRPTLIPRMKKTDSEGSSINQFEKDLTWMKALGWGQSVEEGLPEQLSVVDLMVKLGYKEKFCWARNVDGRGGELCGIPKAPGRLCPRETPAGLSFTRSLARIVRLSGHNLPAALAMSSQDDISTCQINATGWNRVPATRSAKTRIRFKRKQGNKLFLSTCMKSPRRVLVPHKMTVLIC
ncbi:unnamed protein product, partial [Mesorhabditis spiculigera]